jgi:hypothetical protein
MTKMLGHNLHQKTPRPGEKHQRQVVQQSQEVQNSVTQWYFGCHTRLARRTGSCGVETEKKYAVRKTFDSEYLSTFDL